MTYVMSDLHGMRNQYEMMLDRIGGLKNNDKVYILGDVVDRGPKGIPILLSMMNEPRVIPIIGNHEALALTVLKDICSGKPFEEIKKTQAYRIWALNGGESTANGFRLLGRPEQLQIIEYIESFRIYEELEVDGKHCHLSHTLPAFNPDLDIHDCTVQEFIWGEPDYDICYDSNLTFITGHTPTALIDYKSDGKIWHGNGHIAIDCGAAFGGSLGCICLETMEEYYV